MQYIQPDADVLLRLIKFLPFHKFTICKAFFKKLQKFLLIGNIPNKFQQELASLNNWQTQPRPKLNS